MCSRNLSSSVQNKSRALHAIEAIKPIGYNQEAVKVLYRLYRVAQIYHR